MPHRLLYRLASGLGTLDADAALALLQEGNRRFAEATPAQHNRRQARHVTAEQQHPFVAVVSCIDSRVPVEAVFDLTIGNAVSMRVAGHVLSDDVLGSLEFACAVAGVQLIVILGHTGCGAVKGACLGTELGHLTGLLDKIQPAVAEVAAARPDADPEEAAFVDAVAEAHVARTTAALVQQSDVLGQLADTGRLSVVGAMYELATGRVRFLSPLPAPAGA